MTGKYYTPNQFIDYCADVEKPLPMIFQSGYLTIKEYRHRTDTFLLDFPNDEVKKGFVTLLTNNYLKPKENVDSWISIAVDNRKHSIQAVLNIIRGSANFAQKNSNYVQSKRNKQV